MAAEQDLYELDFVSCLFDRCSRNYAIWGNLASFGLVTLWRWKCVRHLPRLTTADATGLDLMAGTGETSSILLKRLPGIISISILDSSVEMIRRAEIRMGKFRNHKIEICHTDVLRSGLSDGTADFIISSFGLKTFNEAQQELLAKEISRLLRPGGVFSFIEISVPMPRALRSLSRFYLSTVMPTIERNLLGTNDLSMIGVYVQNFGDCEHFAQCLATEGLDVQFGSYFFGSATGVTGRKLPAY